MVFSFLRRLSRSAPRPSDRPAAPPVVETLEDRTVPTAAVDPLTAVAFIDPGRPDEVAVGRLYQGLLNRLPEPTGLAYWTNALSQGATTTQIADAFVQSDEYRRTQVHTAYVELLGRSPDASGHQAFVDFIAVGGTLAEARTIIAGSPEYVARSGGTSQDFAQALYRDALGRSPTADELANASSADPTRQASSVFGSGEALRRQAGDAYHRFLSRDADTGGLAYWTDRLVKGTTLQALAAALAGAREAAAPKTLLSPILGDDPAFDVGTLGGDFGPQALALGPPLVFQAFPPERWIDTRAAFPPSNSDGILTPSEVRTFDIRGVASDQGNFLPAGTVAISATLFVVGSTNPSGHWAAYPADLGAVPNIASIYSDHSGAIIASSLILPLGTMGANAGKIKVFSGPGGDIVLDINGVFLRDLNAGDQLRISGNVGTIDQGVIVGTNANAGGSTIHGVIGVISSTAPAFGSSGVRGVNNDIGSNGNGVYGTQAGTGIGVSGFTTGAGQGVRGETGTGGVGVVGVSSGAGSLGGSFVGETGIRGTSNVTGAVNGVFGRVTSGTAAAGSSGVSGTNASTTGGTALSGVSGVLGTVTSSSPGLWSAGVRGINNSTGFNGVGVAGVTQGSGNGVYGETVGAGTGVFGEAGAGGTGVTGRADTGVRGESGSTAFGATAIVGTITSTTPGGNSAGVRGINNGTGSNGIGVFGSQDGTGIGVVGLVSVAGGTGVLGQASAGSSGVHANGNLSASGAKTFVDPHPTDPTKQIVYAALEGPEVGTYFRSRGRFDHGMATVIVPDSFRMSTEAEGLSVQVTPIGRLANVAVQSFDLNQIVLLGSEDVEFFVTVNGVRKGYADFSVIQDNTFFRPRGPEDNLWVSMTAEQRQRLVATGIYNADGTLNLATAQRLGWANGWTTSTTTTA